MHPRVAMLAVTAVTIDLLCLLGAAAVLLTYNPWVMEVGASRFWFIALALAIGLVPMMYLLERVAMMRALEGQLAVRPTGLRAWAGVERSVHIG